MFKVQQRWLKSSLVVTLLFGTLFEMISLRSLRWSPEIPELISRDPWADLPRSLNWSPEILELISRDPWNDLPRSLSWSPEIPELISRDPWNDLPGSLNWSPEILELIYSTFADGRIDGQPRWLKEKQITSLFQTYTNNNFIKIFIPFFY